MWRLYGAAFGILKLSIAVTDPWSLSWTDEMTSVLWIIYFSGVISRSRIDLVFSTTLVGLITCWYSILVFRKNSIALKAVPFVPLSELKSPVNIMFLMPVCDAFR